MDRGAWCAIVHRVAESWTRLKQLSTNMHFINVYEANDYAWFCSPLQYGFNSNKLSFLHLVHICLIMYNIDYGTTLNHPFALISFPTHLKTLGNAKSM